METVSRLDYPAESASLGNRLGWSNENRERNSVQAPSGSFSKIPTSPLIKTVNIDKLFPGAEIKTLTNLSKGSDGRRTIELAEVYDLCPEDSQNSDESTISGTITV